MAETKRGGMTLPGKGIFDATARPEFEAEVEADAEAAHAHAAAAGQGGGDVASEAPAGPKAPRSRRKKAAAPAASDQTEEVKLYLTADIRFRLRMLAFKKGVKVSEAAIEVLDKGLPRWNLERAE